MLAKPILPPVSGSTFKAASGGGTNISISYRPNESPSNAMSSLTRKSMRSSTAHTKVTWSVSLGRFVASMWSSPRIVANASPL